MKEPVDHIMRPSLPWRTGEGAITECGYDASKVPTISRADYFARRKELGQQRCAMLTCMTCSDAAGRWPPWDVDPRTALEREIAWENARRFGENHGQRLRDELFAIAALIEVHRDEFQAAVASSEQRREWLERKAALKERRQNAPQSSEHG